MIDVVISQLPQNTAVNVVIARPLSVTGLLFKTTTVPAAKAIARRVIVEIPIPKILKFSVANHAAIVEKPAVEPGTTSIIPIVEITMNAQFTKISTIAIS